jgi:hypothetical protein
MPRGVPDPKNFPVSFTVVLNLCGGQDVRQISFHRVIADNPLLWARDMAKKLDLKVRLRGGVVLFKEHPPLRADGGYNITLHIAGEDREP